MKSFYVWTIPLLALLVLNGNCHPVEEVSAPTSYEIGDVAKERGSSTVETDFTLSRDKVTGSDPTETTDEGSTGSEAPVPDGSSKHPDEDCRNDSKEMFETQTRDYDKDDYEGTTRKRYRFFTFIDGKTKREVGDVPVEDDTTEGNDKEIMVAESDFVQHDYDYSVKSDYDRRKKREGRIERQSGESVPYVLPNRSRRDSPVYPSDLVPLDENVAEGVPSREREEKRKDGDGDEDEDGDEDGDEDEKKEKEKDC